MGVHYIFTLLSFVFENFQKEIKVESLGGGKSMWQIEGFEVVECIIRV